MSRGAGTPADLATAAGFASSWNSAAPGSVYTRAQALDWLAPLEPAEIAGRDVLELGFGNGSLLAHVAALGPRRLAGVELGDTRAATRANLAGVPDGVLDLHWGDLTAVDLGGFDVVYCIGVLHHLADPEAGFASVLRHTRPGGRFHCWVYGREGNGPVIHLVDPLRRLASRLPWRLTKYALALPLVVPFFLYARALDAVTAGGRRAPGLADRLPLGRYALWIAPSRFRFFHHVAFDQLVAARTRYFRRAELEAWLRHEEVEPGSAYLVARNGNSWKLGGRRRR